MSVEVMIGLDAVLRFQDLGSNLYGTESDGILQINPTKSDNEAQKPKFRGLAGVDYAQPGTQS